MLIHVSQPSFSFLSLMIMYFDFLAWGVVSGLGFNFVYLQGIGKGNLHCWGQPCPIVNLPALGKLLNNNK